MSKLFRTLFFILLIHAPSYAGTIPVSGTIKTAGGIRFNGSIRLTLSYAAAKDFCSNNIVVAQVVSFPVRNGILPSNAVITPNDCLSPAHTFYTAQYLGATGAVVAQNIFYVSGQTFDIGTATPTPLTTSNISFTDLTGLDEVSTNSLILPDNAAPPASTVGKTIIYTDNTGTAKICQNGAACSNLVNAVVSSPWTRTAPVTSLVTTTDRVLVGTTDVGNFSASPTFDGAIIGTNWLYVTNGTTTNAIVGFMGYDGISNSFKVGVGVTGSGAQVPLAFQTASGTLLGTSGKIRGAFLAGDPGTFIIGADTATGTITAKQSATNAMEVQWNHNGGSMIGTYNGSSGNNALAGFLASDDAAAGIIQMYATSSGYTTALGLSDHEGVIQTIGGLTKGMVIKSNNTIHFQPGQNTDLLAMSANQATVTGTTGSALFPVVINGNSTTGSSFGLEINAGTNGSDYALYVQNAAQSIHSFEITGAGLVRMVGTNTVAAFNPSTTFSVTGGAASGFDALDVACTNLGTCYGMTINGGNTSADYALQVQSRSGTPFMTFRGDGALVTNLTTTGSATGKKVVCVDTATGILYASSASNNCAN